MTRAFGMQDAVVLRTVPKFFLNTQANCYARSGGTTSTARSRATVCLCAQINSFLSNSYTILEFGRDELLATTEQEINCISTLSIRGTDFREAASHSIKFQKTRGFWKQSLFLNFDSFLLF